MCKFIGMGLHVCECKKYDLFAMMVVMIMIKMEIKSYNGNSPYYYYDIIKVIMIL